MFGFSLKFDLADCMTTRMPAHISVHVSVQQGSCSTLHGDLVPACAAVAGVCVCEGARAGKCCALTCVRLCTHKRCNIHADVSRASRVNPLT